MKKIILLIFYFFSSFASYAGDVIIDFKDMYSFTDNILTVKNMNKNKDFLKAMGEYDIGLNHSYDLPSLIDFLGHYNSFNISDEEKYEYILKDKGVINENSSLYALKAFELHKIKKEYDFNSVVKMYDEAISKANDIINQIDHIVIKNVPGYHLDGFRTYDFDKEIYKFTDPQGSRPRDYVRDFLADIQTLFGANLAICSENSVASNIKVCEKIDELQYMKIPFDIAENIDKNSDKYLSFIDVKLKFIDKNIPPFVLEPDEFEISIHPFNGVIQLEFHDKNYNNVNNVYDNTITPWMYVIHLPSAQKKEVYRTKIYYETDKNSFDLNKNNEIPSNTSSEKESSVMLNEWKRTLFCKTKNNKILSVVSKDGVYKYEFGGLDKNEISLVITENEYRALLDKTNSSNSKLIFKNGNIYYHIFDSDEAKGVRVYKNIGSGEKILGTVYCL